MRFLYSEWREDEFKQNMKFEDLLKLFNQLLIHTSGDVDEALHWLTQLDQEHHFFTEDFGFDDFLRKLKEEGYVKEQERRNVLTPKGEKQIRKDSLDQIFSLLKKSPQGFHETNKSGEGVERLSETKPFRFGDNPSNLDFTSTINNAIKRDGIESINLREEDFEVYETEHLATCATCLLIDISHSMILYGEDRITPAKKTALALIELILTKYPKDSLNVIVFGDEAREVAISDVAYIEVGPFHTNTKAGLNLARKILKRKKNANKQVFMITDGKPSAIFEKSGKLYKNPFGLDRRIVNQTLNEAANCKRERISISTFMVTTDSYLRSFVEELTEINKGRAFYSSLNQLGEYVFVDYLRNRRRNVK